jgi:hypothetical protein
MITGQKRYYADVNRIFTAEDLHYGLMEYFKNPLDALMGEVLYPQSGLFNAIPLAADGNDKFKLSSYQDLTGMVDGCIWSAPEDAAVLEGVQFENALGIDYHIAIGRSWYPEGVEIGPKDGLPKIKFVKEVCGRDGDVPDAVVDNLDGTLTFTVDTITELGVSNAGREVLVIKFPLDKGATSEAIAWQVCTVVWDGSNNKITTVDTPAGAGYFGQTSPSTSPSDYQVLLRGPLVSRNTDLSVELRYAYLGTVTGTGAGNPPSVFDTSGQVVYGMGGASNLWQITRTVNVPPDRLKIDVKATAAEENAGIDQIRVSGWDGGGSPLTVFAVDELGNVSIQGDLTVQGETTQEDVVQVNSDETITGALTAGDNDSDSHEIQGEWTHASDGKPGGAGNVFVIDGDTGRIGIGDNYSASYEVAIYGNAAGNDAVLIAAGTIAMTGQVEVEGNLMPNGATRDIGASGTEWDDIWCNTLHTGGLDFAGHLLPGADDTYDLGENSTPLEWRNLYIDGTAYIDTLSLGIGAGEGVVTHLLPEVSATDTLRCGNATNRWLAVQGKFGIFEEVDIYWDGVTPGTGYLMINDQIPSIRFQDDDASGANDQRYWRIGCFANGRMDFRSYDDAESAYHEWFAANKNASSERVDDIFLDADDELSLAGGNSVNLQCSANGSTILLNCEDTVTIRARADGGGTGEVIIDGDLVPDDDETYNLGRATDGEWNRFYLNSKDGYGMATSLMPDTDVSYNLGNYNPSTEGGYRWQIGAFVQMMVAEDAGGGNPPIVYFFEEGQSADEGLWGWHIDTTSHHLTLSTFSDSAVIGTDIMECYRGTGNVCDQVRFGVDISPNAAGLACGLDTYPWGEMWARQLNARGSDATQAPTVQWYHDDAPTNEVRWKAQGLTNGDWELATWTTADVAGKVAIRITRTGITVDTIEFGSDCDLKPITTGNVRLGYSGAEFESASFDLDVRCRTCHADGDSGGVTGTNAITSGFSGVSTGNGQVKMNGTTARDSTGWLWVRIGTDLRYIPYWTQITG